MISKQTILQNLYFTLVKRKKTVLQNATGRRSLSVSSQQQFGENKLNHGVFPSSKITSGKYGDPRGNWNNNVLRVFSVNQWLNNTSLRP